MSRTFVLGPYSISSGWLDPAISQFDIARPAAVASWAIQQLHHLRSIFQTCMATKLLPFSYSAVIFITAGTFLHRQTPLFNMIFMRSAVLTVAIGSTRLASGAAFAPYPSRAFRPVGGADTHIRSRVVQLAPSATCDGLVVAPGIRTKSLSTSLHMAVSDDDHDDDDDDMDDGEHDPLSRGVDSVRWLPTIIDANGPTKPMSPGDEGGDLLPLFPLGGIVYTPNSEHILNIFEPRYRQMYTDILMNGTKRFVVSMSHPSEEGRFAQMGVLFQLEDLKEVSEQTADQIKYICNHKVVGRVKLNRVLNPEVWASRDTYLRAEGTVIDDIAAMDEDGEAKDESLSNDAYSALASSAGTSLSPEEKALKDCFMSLVEAQHDLEEDVRFTRASAATLAVGAEATGDNSLWTTIRLWQSYTEQRLVARQNEMQKEFQDKLLEFLTQEKGVKEEEIPSAIGFSDLSPDLQKEVSDLQRRMSLELRPLVLESTLTMQKILESENHEQRCTLLRHFIDAERRRLSAKKTLKGMFLGDAKGSFLDESFLAPSKASTVDESDSFVTDYDEDDDGDRGIFLDDDAFQ